MRFATIGTNFITDWFTAAARQVPGCEVAAAYSRNVETGNAFAEKHGIPRVVTDFDTLAQDGSIDAVYIASPNSLHCEQALALMAAGKHVLCEKPAASNTRQVEALLAAAKRHGVVFLEAIRNVHTPSLEIIRAALPRIGRVRRVSFLFNQYSSRYEPWLAGQKINTFDVSLSNGGVVDLGVYCVEPLLALFGPPQEICARAVFLPGSIDAQGAILCVYEHFLAELSYSKVSQAVTPSVIQGEAGSITIPHLTTAAAAELVLRTGESIRLPYNQNEDDMVYEIAHFMEYAAGQKPEELARYQGLTLKTHRLLDEARRQMGIVFPADEAQVPAP